MIRFSGAVVCRCSALPPQLLTHRSRISRSHRTETVTSATFRSINQLVSVLCIQTQQPLFTFTLPLSLYPSLSISPLSLSYNSLILQLYLTVELFSQDLTNSMYSSKSCEYREFLLVHSLQPPQPPSGHYLLYLLC